MEISHVGAELYAEGQTKLVVALRNFVIAPKNQ